MMLKTVDLDAKLNKEEYKSAMEALDQRLPTLHRALHSAGVPVLIVFEGWDAAGKGTVLSRLQHLCYTQRRPVAIVYEGWDASGKGGNIRRLVRDLDPRGYEVVPFAVPQGDEKTHHYLWRFWRALPKAGHFTVFDRSWYGRVLVERIEGFASYPEWMRAYREIKKFEADLVDYGMANCASRAALAGRNGENGGETGNKGVTRRAHA